MKQIRNLSNSLLPFLAITLALCIFTLAALPATVGAFPRPLQLLEVQMPGDDDPDHPFPLTDGEHQASEVQVDDSVSQSIGLVFRILDILL